MKVFVLSKRTEKNILVEGPCINESPNYNA